MSLEGVFVCLLLVLNAISTAPSYQREKRQEPPLPQGFPQQFHASQQGIADPSTTQNRQNPPEFLPAGTNSNHTVYNPSHDQDHVKVGQNKNDFANSEGSLKLSVSTKITNKESTEVNPSPDQKTVKDSAALQLEKLIEDHRLANMKHRERQLQQLVAAKAQLEKQIENQKQLQLKWLEDKMIENKTISEVVTTVVEEYTNGNNSYTDKDSAMLYKANQNNEVEIIDEVDKSTENILTNESEENPAEEQGAKLLLAGLVSDNKSLGHEDVSKTEQKNEKLFELAKDNGEGGHENTPGDRFGDYTTEIGLQFESITQEETSLFDNKELETPDKASNKLDIPREVSDAIDLVSRYFQLKNSKNLSAPEYVWMAVQELSNYLN